MKSKIKIILASLAVLLFCSWYDPILDLFTNAPTATVDAANDWILFHDVTDGKKKKVHPSALGGGSGFTSGPNTLTSSLGTISLTRKRISIASTTTVYLVGQATFSAGTTSAFGGITARRVR